MDQSRVTVHVGGLADPLSAPRHLGAHLVTSHRRNADVTPAISPPLPSPVHLVQSPKHHHNARAGRCSKMMASEERLCTHVCNGCVHICATGASPGPARSPAPGPSPPAAPPLAVGETLSFYCIPPLPLVGVSIGINRGRAIKMTELSPPAAPPWPAASRASSARSGLALNMFCQ